MNDLKLAFRQLRKSPGFTLIAVLTLALGIGANTAIFSVVQNILLQPLPYANSARLYAIWASYESAGQRQIAASGPDYLDYRDQNRSFARIAEYLPRFTFTWTGEGEPKLVTCTGVSKDFFATLGVHAYLGRLYEPREYTYLENDSMVVSYRFWKNQLGGDPHIIGRTIRLQDDSVTIIGVLPPMSDLFPDTDVWPKLTTNPSWPFMQWRSNKFLRVIGELRPGVTPAMAEEDLTAILRRAPEQATDVRVQLVPLKDDLVGNVRVALFATQVAAALILIVACINVAALLLSRAVKRQGEMALRLSLGASFARIGRQLVIEAMLLSAIGCAAGLLFAWSLLRVLTTIPNLPLPRLDAVHLNTPALLVTLVITVATTLLFGWIPALNFSRLDLSSALCPRDLATGGRRRSSLSVLVIAEIACSLVLTVSVGLLLHSFWRVMHVNPGFQAQSLLRVYLRSDSPPNDPDGIRQYATKNVPFWQSVLREASSLPGVHSVALSDWRPGRDAAIATLMFEDRANDPARLPTIDGSWVSADFFQTVGDPVAAGRSFNEHDIAAAPAVAIINVEAARQFWPGENPIGKRIGINYTGPGRRTSNDVPRMREIIGVVGNMKHGALDGPTAPAVYLPYLQDETYHDMSAMNLLVRSEGNSIALRSGLRDCIHRIRPNEPVQEISSVEEMLATSVAPRRYTLFFLGAFATLGLLLATIGVYGVISYTTSQRTREFGIRIALGATRGRVISRVLHEGFVLVAAGSLLGVGAALALTRTLSSLLFEISPLDATSFTAGVAVLGVAALCACVIPAWRASRVDPMDALRTE
jgi:putative ABC transport system permease protein